MRTFIISLKIFFFFTILTGIIYPLFITGVVQVLFPSQANGSLIKVHDKIIGSRLIAQQSDSNIYFTSRPSAIGYNPLPSGASNLGLTSKKLKAQFDSIRQHFISCNELDSKSVIPSEMLFASGSGLDPEISPDAALLQVDRITKARHFDPIRKQKIIECIRNLTQQPQFLFLGEERVNVLLLNLSLDRI